MGYFMQDAIRAGDAAAKEGMNERQRQRYEEYAGKHVAGDGSSVNRAHFDQVVVADLSRRGVVDCNEVAAAKERGWKEVAEPALREWEKRYGASMPPDVFKGVFAAQPAAARLTDAEVEQRYRVLCQDFGASAVAAVDAEMRELPATRAAMRTMGTEQSAWAARKLVEAHKERGKSVAGARPWTRR
jgi:hypothetical protein